jgi:hypothetical protein
LAVLVWRAPVGDRAVVVQTLAPRVATVAVWSVIALFATGIFATALHLSDARSLWSTAYGAGLLTKILVFIVMLAIGGWFLLRTRLPARAHAQQPGAMRVLIADIALGGVALLAAAAITLVPPARAIQSRAESPPADERSPSGAATPRRTELLLGAESGDLHIRLEVRPVAPGANRFSVRVATTGGQPLDEATRVIVRLTNLEEDTVPATVSLVRGQTGVHEAQSAALSVPAFWRADVVVRRRGKVDVTVALPILLGARVDRGSDPAATALLVGAERAFDKVASWRQQQQVTDTSGGTVSVHAEFVRPDRIRTRTRTSELIIVGRSQVRRGADGTLQRTVLPAPLQVAFPYLAAGAARNAALGREVDCALERCRVVLWESVGRTATYAALVGIRTRFVHDLFMITPSRHTTVHISDINGRIRIELP